jgi:hypothetical protein
VKKVAFVILAAIVSTSSFAGSCEQDARDVAKLNLDQVARKYGFESSDLGSSKLVGKEKVKITEKVSETLSSFEVNGGIYRANYTVKVKLDESCAVRNVSIREDRI